MQDKLFAKKNREDISKSINEGVSELLKEMGNEYLRNTEGFDVLKNEYKHKIKEIFSNGFSKCMYQLINKPENQIEKNYKKAPFGISWDKGNNKFVPKSKNRYTTMNQQLENLKTKVLQVNPDLTDAEQSIVNELDSISRKFDDIIDDYLEQCLEGKKPLVDELNKAEVKRIGALVISMILGLALTACAILLPVLTAIGAVGFGVAAITCGALFSLEMVAMACTYRANDEFNIQKNAVNRFEETMDKNDELIDIFSDMKTAAEHMIELQEQDIGR